jgi:SAM-dependent methyltransferase
MADTTERPTRDIRRNWSEYVQSAAQLGFSRVAKFPPRARNRLASLLDLKDGEHILEVGCGLGILSGRLRETQRPTQVVGCDMDDDLLRSDLPESLRPDVSPNRIRADGFNLPFEENAFDRLITHTVVNLLDRDETSQLHQETRRVLEPGGTVTHMDGLGGDRWSPWELEDPGEEQERREQFFELLKSTHDDLETGFSRSVENFSQNLDRGGFDNIRVDTYSTALRLNNPEWNETQRKLLLELWQRADRDRVERLRNLLQATDRLTPEWGQLLRNCTADAQQQALRRRKALSENREVGWRSSTTLVFSAKNPAK